MKRERPILMSTPMLQALLAGRKTQTRRICKEDWILKLTDHKIEAIYGDHFERDTRSPQLRLQSWQRWKDLFEDTICWFWKKGVRGLVCISRTQNKKGLSISISLPSRQEDDQKRTSSDMYGISWLAGETVAASSSLGRESREQQTGQSEVGDSARKLAGSKGSWKRDGRRKASYEQINGQRTRVYKMGSGKGYCITESYCEDVGLVAIRYSEDLPYEKGMILWVRETFIQGQLMDAEEMFVYDDNGHPIDKTWYRADGDLDRWFNGSSMVEVPWKPSIRMPKSAARIWLEITDIRVERVNDISEADAIAEGIIVTTSGDSGIGEVWYKDYFADASGYGHPDHDFPIVSSPVESYASLWKSINGPESLQANPWVWVVEFKIIGVLGKPETINQEK
jgi:hypothetical protein